MADTSTYIPRPAPVSEERLKGIVERVTFHSSETGWSVLKVSPFDAPQSRVAVVVHQIQVFAGATMEFHGHWTTHPKFGEQFKARSALELKPASVAALEKYLGSGLIHGVGPATARKIVGHFGEQTLAVFEKEINKLTEIRGIAEKKLSIIRTSWEEHRHIREVTLFLQQYGVSTLYSVKIYKAYGDDSIAKVRENPYRLARDIYGIGFFSADRIALALGFERAGEPRLEAGIRHVLSASRDEGHCYLALPQIQTQTMALLNCENDQAMPDRIASTLAQLVKQGQVQCRFLPPEAVGPWVSFRPPEDEAKEASRPAMPGPCYYANSLYREENQVAKIIGIRSKKTVPIEQDRVEAWIELYCARSDLPLSGEQRASIRGVVEHSIAILTGGPGCGKTTTTRALVRLVQAMGKRLLLAAPTGRAAQRMTEVIGVEARTIHRLLEWDPREGGFKRNEENPLECDFLIIDEASMLDISLAASLLAATPEAAQILLIGDPDQLPSVGAGNVMHDLLATTCVARFRLTQIFRQAATSHIICTAHAINRGESPYPPSPFADASVWQQKIDCLFVDAEEATQDQLRFLRRAKAVIGRIENEGGERLLTDHEGAVRGQMTRDDEGAFKVREAPSPFYGRPAGAEEPGVDLECMEAFMVPKKFLHVDLERVASTRNGAEELAAVMHRIPYHSALRYGLSASEVVLRLYTKTIPEKLGADTEIQVLTPMNRGSLGAQALNVALQEAVNPPEPGKAQIQLGERIFRVGDRVIQRRNNYDKGVFNGDIGRIAAADSQAITCTIRYANPDGEHLVTYKRDDMAELGLAYAITIHKSQGSEFDAVIIPLTAQHHKMLYRNVIYTGLTRAKKLAIFVGNRYAFKKSVENIDSRKRQTALTYLLER